MCLTCALINPFGGNWLHASSGAVDLNEADVPGGDVANGPDGAFELSAGDRFQGTLGEAGDRDWFAVSFEEGALYTVTLTPGTMANPIIFLADETGTIVQMINAGGDGEAESFEFSPEFSGTGYIIADSVSNQFDTSDPDWGTDLGSYTLELTFEPPPPVSVTPLDTIVWNYTAPAEIQVYFVPGETLFIDGNIAGGQTTVEWTEFRLAQARLAFDLFEEVADVTFTFTDTPEDADFFMVQSTDERSTLGYWGVAGGNVSIDGVTHTVAGWGVMHDGGRGWTDPGLVQGGFGFITLIHEIGHGMGLAHPHDPGGGSSIMLGVDGSFRDRGNFNLNQGINTTMSYNDGWQTAPHGASPDLEYGYQGTLMAFDIAVLQAKYGANMTTRTGDDSYVLASDNVPGSFYAAIWDAGGTDAIVHHGSTAAVIDLRAASLDYSALGGGAVSYVVGIHGGFTIAAGVVIENATGGSGNDTIGGNSADNRLVGDGGHDEIQGLTGRDTLMGGLGDDTLLGGAGFDRLYGGADHDSLAGGNQADNLFGDDGNDTLDGGNGRDRLFGGAGDDHLDGGDGVDALRGGGGHDMLIGAAGSDVLFGGTGRDTLDGGDDADMLWGGAGFDRLLGGDGDDALHGGNQADNLFGDAGNDTLMGDNGNDRLFGGFGRDLLDGDDGNDVLRGGAGFDTLIGGAGDDVLIGGGNWDVFVFHDGHGNDTITDFAATNRFERIDLSAMTTLAAADFDGLVTASAISSHMGGVMIATGSGSIFLQNTDLADLDSSDFIFA